MVAYFLISIYTLGCLFTGWIVYDSLSKKNKDGDPEALDLLTASAAAIFWPLVVPFFLLISALSG